MPSTSSSPENCAQGWILFCYLHAFVTRPFKSLEAANDCVVGIAVVVAARWSEATGSPALGISGQTRVETDVSCVRVRLSTTEYIRLCGGHTAQKSETGNRPRATPRKGASRPKTVLACCGSAEHNHEHTNHPSAQKLWLKPERSVSGWVLRECCEGATKVSG